MGIYILIALLWAVGGVLWAFSARQSRATARLYRGLSPAVRRFTPDPARFERRANWYTVWACVHGALTIGYIVAAIVAAVNANF